MPESDHHTTAHAPPRMSAAKGILNYVLTSIVGAALGFGGSQAFLAARVNGAQRMGDPVERLSPWREVLRKAREEGFL